MSLWNTSQALGLKCTVVPIMTSPYSSDYRDGPVYVCEPAFRTFNGPRLGGFEMDEGISWGREMPESKLTWLNADQKEKKSDEGGEEQAQKKPTPSFKEVQLAYMTVSSSGNAARCYFC